MPKTKNLIFLLIALLVLSYILQSNYFVIKPGTVENLSEIIMVENSKSFANNRSDNDGALYLVTVAQQPANLLLFLSAFLDPAVDLVPRWRVLPPDMDSEEYNKIMQQYMIDSQHLAKIIALKKAGFDVPITSEGILVVELMNDSPAKNILTPGDVILELDGEKVFLAEELVQKIQRREAGSTVNLTFKRNGEVLIKEIPTVPAEEGNAALKIYVKTLEWEPILPVDIKIDTGEIAGPSAGLMFVLEIINQLTEEDITQGKKIAGTGTINSDEIVGPIGGIKQKIAAAEAAGAEIFLVPSENMVEARQAARKIELVEVKDLDKALNYLGNLAGHTLGQDVVFLPEYILGI